MIRQILHEEEGREKLAEGIRKLCTVLSGEGQILVNGSYTMSAQTVAKQIEGTDRYRNQGIRLAAEAIAEINTRTGCGTKEAARMMSAQQAACERAVSAGMNPVVLSETIRKAAGRMADEAMLAAEHDGFDLMPGLLAITRDEGLAEMVLRGMETGELIIKESMQRETSMKIVKGMTVSGRLLAGGAASLRDVKVLVTSRSLTSFADLLPLLEKLGRTPLLLVADDIGGEALTLLKTNIEKQRISVWAIKAPGIGRRKADMLEDLAALTGTAVYGEYPPFTWEEFPPELLGTAHTAEVAAESTVVAGPAGLAGPAVAGRIARIRDQIKDPGTNFYDQQVLRERIACLCGQVPVIYAGGETMAEIKAEKLRLEYAAAYAQSVKEYGMLPQGFASRIRAESPAEKIVLAGIRKGLEDKAVSAGLFDLLLRKTTSLTAMWLTTGAVMVSIGYDREDRELIRSGVDIERLRG